MSSRLDNLESIHARAVGSARAPRWDMRQFNGQLFVALVGTFQGFARALHDDATDWLRGQGDLAALVANQAVVNRRLDRGNPSVENLTHDFARLGLNLWSRIRETSPRRERRLRRLDRAVQLRNGVAHEDLRSLESAGAGAPADRAEPTLSSYRIHRSALDALAVEMDRLVGNHLATLVGTRRPW